MHRIDTWVDFRPAPTVTIDIVEALKMGWRLPHCGDRFGVNGHTYEVTRVEMKMDSQSRLSAGWFEGALVAMVRPAGVPPDDRSGR